jgi:UDP-N-acetylmuramoyl-L-alanyl-D-glutamate--2,6-diaminopimelate ligase
MTGSPRALRTLLDRVSGIHSTVSASNDVRDVEIRGITANSRQVAPGDLFVAIPGSQADGHTFIADAVARGAAAVVVQRDPTGVLDVPIVRAENTRRLLAELASAWYDDPASRLRLIGITGTLGKTSTLMMLAAILERAGRRIGTIGSLGMRARGVMTGTGHTVPDPLVLHAGLAQLAAAQCEIAAMEVTSHALDQERVHGLRYELGIFTNLVPMEHADYHTSFREYVEVKSRFFEHLEPGAPLVYSSDDAVVRGMVRERWLPSIGCGERADSAVRIQLVELGSEGTRLMLIIPEALALGNGGTLEPQRIEITLRLLGRSSVTNAALAVTAALCLGASPRAAADALASFPPSRRRMEIMRHDGITVLDDTIGHPESLSALFDVVQKLPFRDLHVAVAVRGSRGEQINTLLAQSLAIWLGRVPAATLVITRSIDAADERNRVEDAEMEAFLAPLRQAGIPLVLCARLDETVHHVVDRARREDLILLLGAQGMDDAAAILRRLWDRDTPAGGDNDDAGH